MCFLRGNAQGVRGGGGFLSFLSSHREGEKVESELSSGRDGAFAHRRRGGVRVQHGKRGVLPEAAEDLPMSPSGHRGLRGDVRGHDVVRDAQTAQEDGGDGTEVSATPRVAVGTAPR